MSMKLILVAFLGAIIAAFFALGGHQLLTLEQLSQSSAELIDLKDRFPIVTAIGFFMIYVAVTALSLPGAAILTLAAGAIFGFGVGLILVSFSSSIGATLAFLVSRYLLRDSIQDKFGQRLNEINKGVEKEGAFYLFTLRLVPVFPFFLINLLMGLTSIPTRTFYWVSQVGMLAGTAVYINAGTQLAQLDSLSGILSPALIASFCLLGIFPIIAKRVIDLIKAKHVYKGFKKPRKFDSNIIVLGAGAGGLVTSYIGAAVKAKVTLIEKNKMGGDCLNYGCVPSKALIHAAKQYQAVQKASEFSITASNISIDFKGIFQRINRVIEKIEPHDSVERYTQLGVDVISGEGRIVDPWTVEINTASGGSQLLTAPNIVIASGASPIIPEIPGIQDCPYVTSDTLWDYCSALNEAPKNILILGGGPIGCELAQAFARLGIRVTQIERGQNLMSREDEDVSEHVYATLTHDGVNVLLNTEALSCRNDGAHNWLSYRQQDGQEQDVEFDLLICAIGRQARLSGFGLENLGMADSRTIEADEFLRTRFPNIYAVGDVVGPYQFTHVAAHQAWYAAVNSLFGHFKRFKVDYSVIPRVTFIEPEVARVGLSEKEATEQGIQYEVTRYGIDDLDRAITESTEQQPANGFVKVLTVSGKDTILGVTIVGMHAGELLAEYVLAMKHGLGLNKILGTIHSYPTWSEANKYAAGEWKRKHAPESVLRWLERYFTWRRS